MGVQVKVEIEVEVRVTIEVGLGVRVGEQWLQLLGFRVQITRTPSQTDKVDVP